MYWLPVSELSVWLAEGRLEDDSFTLAALALYLGRQMNKGNQFT